MAQNRVRPDVRLTPSRRFSVFGFFGDVFGELRKVTWPTRQEATRLTMLVIALAAVMGVFLGAFDWMFARIFSLLAGT
ncbi:MAG: preprotein translocase subunit SecE [Chloroflexi bacterium]|nr:preprotein translocase subunit SecE [Chloroflexota bacterium]MXZ03129.1 preprotein translocase subunit SecE [Chloroflexota bacterium]MYF78973.1 preprotein translocase subunit SecE [Chloroflexota bacterium]MYK61921.1 preprotein translocase subunit SecE [Chloroflexota bacterium]